MHPKSFNAIVLPLGKDHSVCAASASADLADTGNKLATQNSPKKHITASLVNLGLPCFY